MKTELELYIKANYAKLEGYTLIPVKDAFEAAWQAAKAQSVMEPSIDLNGHDIKRITHFMCYEDPENLDTEVTIQVFNSGFSGAGLYAWVAEYPGEGGIKLSESPQEQNQ